MMFLFLLLMIIFKLSAQNSENFIIKEPISEDCLQCICESTQDNPIKCHMPTNCEWTAVVDGCGPFLLQYSYWDWSGRRNAPNSVYTNSIKAWRDCTRLVECSKDVVRDFVYKYAEDCNGDGIIDCDDYVKIHLYHIYCTSKEEDPRQLERFYRCRNYITPRHRGNSTGINHKNFY